MRTIGHAVEPNNLLLTIRNRVKSIPYGGGDAGRSDGSKNFGFKRLKGNKELAESIPEAQDSEALKRALVRLNDPSAAFFTVGCEKSYNTHEKGFWVRGYLEFAFNFVELVSGAQNYFKLFFEFNTSTTRIVSDLPKAQFEFQPEGGQFHDGPATGYSVSVWVNTSLCVTREESIGEWGKALSLLVDFLEPLEVKPGLTPIYAPGKPYANLYL
jgi:hypothetical protein